MNYYNEWDKKTAAWLQELINQRLIPDGHVDTRSICDVQPGDLDGYTQCHFFAGIGGWSLALQLAGWPPDRPVWTGSCPCQPFSAAGKQKGTADERHVWPEMFRLARVCRPHTIFGEQVEGAVRLGWLDGVFADLEGEGYTCGAAVLGAHSVGAPHIRQRLYWVADARHSDISRTETERWEARGAVTGGYSGLANAQRRPAERHGYELAGATRSMQRAARERQRIRDDAGNGGTTHRLADATRREAQPAAAVGLHAEPRGGSGLVHHNRTGPQQGQQVTEAARYGSPAQSAGSGLGDADSAAQERLGLVSLSLEPQQEAGRPGYATPWQGATAIPCADGKSRRVEPRIQLLAHGIPARVVRLRGYGNAINPWLAAEFIGAYMEATA